MPDNNEKKIKQIQSNLENVSNADFDLDYLISNGKIKYEVSDGVYENLEFEPYDYDISLYNVANKMEDFPFNSSFGKDPITGKDLPRPFTYLMNYKLRDADYHVKSVDRLRHVRVVDLSDIGFMATKEEEERYSRFKELIKEINKSICNEKESINVLYDSYSKKYFNTKYDYENVYKCSKNIKIKKIYKALETILLEDKYVKKHKKDAYIEKIMNESTATEAKIHFAEDFIKEFNITINTNSVSMYEKDEGDSLTDRLTKQECAIFYDVLQFVSKRLLEDAKKKNKKKLIELFNCPEKELFKSIKKDFIDSINPIKDRKERFVIEHNPRYEDYFSYNLSDIIDYAFAAFAKCADALIMADIRRRIRIDRILQFLPIFVTLPAFAYGWYYGHDVQYTLLKDTIGRYIIQGLTLILIATFVAGIIHWIRNAVFKRKKLGIYQGVIFGLTFLLLASNFMMGEFYVRRYTGYDDTYYYSLRLDGSVVLDRLFDKNSGETEYIIPETIDGYPVKAISSELFKNNTDVERVIMEENTYGIVDVYFMNRVKIEDTTGAFENCTNLKEVVLPSSQLSIPKNTFLNCTSLETVKATFASEAFENSFENCSSLTNIDGLESLTKVYKNTFKDCTSLDVDFDKIPIVHFGENSFYNTAVSHIVLKDQEIEAKCFYGTNKLVSLEFDYEDKVVWDYFDYESTRSLKSLYVYTESNFDTTMFSNSPLVSVEIDGLCETITEGAFKYCQSLQKVKLCNNITEIKASAFEDCNSLKEITIPKSLETIGEYAFKNCLFSELDFKSTRLSLIGNGAFLGNQKLTKVVFSDLLNIIEDNAFRNCTELAKCEFDTDFSIGYLAFDNTSISDYSDYIYETTLAHPLHYYFGDIIEYVVSLDIADISRVPDNYFEGYYNLKSIKLPNAVDSIGNYSFSGCTSLVDISYADTLSHVGSGAFMNCSSLTTVQFPYAQTIVEPETFRGCTSLVTINLSEELTMVGDMAFADCSVLEEVYVPANQDLGKDVFLNTNLKRITIDCDGHDLQQSFSYYFGETSKYTVESIIFINCASIPKEIFAGFVALQEFKAVNDLYTVEYGAFNGCKSLTVVSLPNTVEEIQASAFMDCSSLTSINLPTDITIIHAQTFENCSSLASIYIPKEVTEIEARAFYGCEALKKVVTDNKEITLGEDTFTDTSLTDFNVFINEKNISHTMAYYYGIRAYTKFPNAIIDNISAIPNDYFKDFIGIKNVTISNVKEIGANAFTGCTTLINLSIANSVVKIGAGAFMDCGILKNFTLPEHISIIESQTFENCKSLTSMDIPTEVSTISSRAFFGCESLSKITTKNIEVALGEDTFTDTSLTDFNVFLNDSNAGNPMHFYYGIRAYEEFHTIDIQEMEDIPDGYFENYVGINSVTIRNGVNTIGANAFTSCINMASCTIDDSVREIKDQAFSKCIILSSINIPKGIDHISAGTFEYCNAIATMVIPENVTEIRDNAFNGCEKLSGISVVNSDVNLGENAFAGTLLTNFNTFISDSNLDHTMDFYFGQRAKTNFPTVVISKIEEIPANYFEGYTGITSVEFKDKVRVIGDAAFKDCVYIDTITIPGTIDTIGASAFSGSRAKSVDIKEGVSSIGEYAFYDNDTFTSVAIPSSVSIIEAGTFAQCEKLSTVIIPKNLKEIRSNAFLNDMNLKLIMYPGVVKNIEHNIALGENSFKGTQIYDIDIFINSNNLAHPLSYYFGQEITEKIEKVSVTQVDNIPDSYFMNFYALESITISDEVKTIGNEAFANCYVLNNVVIPNSVTAIGSYAFESCVELTDISLSSSMTKIDKGTFKNTKLMSIKLPEGISFIDAEAFMNSTYFTTINSANPDIELSQNSFANTSMVNVDLFINYKNVGNKLTYYFGSDIIDRLTEATISRIDNVPKDYFDSCTELTTVHLTENVVSIQSGAFSNCTKLETIELPNSLIDIKTDAFKNCTHLSTIYTKNTNIKLEKNSFSNNILSNVDMFINDNNVSHELSYYFGSAIKQTLNTVSDIHIASIPAGYFKGFTGLICVDLSSVVTSIGKEAFMNCSYLTTVILPASITEIGAFVFKDCKSLTEIVLPSYLDTIGEGVFQYCTSLKTIEIPATVTKFKNNAFDGCTELHDINIPMGTIEIEKQAFKNCVTLATLILPSSLDSIGKEAFINCKSLNDLGSSYGSVKLSKNTFKNTAITDIGVAANRRNSRSLKYYFGDGIKNKIRSATIGDMEKIPNNYFRQFKNLKVVYLSDAVTTIGKNAFRGSSIEAIYMSDSVTSIGSGAFYNCKYLGLVELSAGLESIPKNCFRNCTSLWSIDFKNVTSVGKSAFKKCVGLSEIKGMHIETIESRAFSRCTYIESVDLPRVVTIGNYAFYKNKSLYDLSLSSYVEEIGMRAFSYCGNIVSVDNCNPTVKLKYKAFGSTYLSSIDPFINDNNTRGLWFYYGNDIKNNLYSVSITNLKTVKNSYFKRCKKLTIVELNDVETVGKYAFRYCPVLQKVEVNGGLTSIEKCAFADNDSLTEISINDVSTIGSGAFSGCNYLSNVSFTGVSEIEKNAFRDCNRLEYAYFSGTISKIGEGAFYGATALYSMVVNGSVNALGQQAFAYCSSLSEFEVSGLTELGNQAMLRTNISEIKLENVTSLGKRVFEECSNLRSAAISGSITEIKSNTFYKCTSLSYVAIPSSVTKVGMDAFKNVPTGLSVDYSGNKSTLVIDSGNDALSATIKAASKNTTTAAAETTN